PMLVNAATAAIPNIGWYAPTKRLIVEARMEESSWISMPDVRRMKTKLVLMGEGGVGKTSLVRRFVLNEYQDTYLHTVGTRVNKKDLEAQRAFSDEEIRQAAETFAAPYVLTSALTGEFVEDAFNALAIEMVTRAFRQEDTRAVERGLRQKALVLLDKRGSIGLKKQQFFEILRGVKVDELQAELDRLEREVLVTILWYGASDVAVTLTPRGVKAVKQSCA